MWNPSVIQGGMGIGVSNWVLAREVSRLGELGVVSGTGLSSVLVRRLQDGDVDGSIREALRYFPDWSVSESILRDYFIPNGRKPGTPYKRCQMYTLNPSLGLQQLTVAANFVEVFLAKQGHSGAVGLNLLEKIQLATLPSLYGAMLAGVDFVLMGAGIPREIPGALDRLSRHETATLRIHVEGAEGDDEFSQSFTPGAVIDLINVPPPKRPRFLPIVSSYTLAANLLKKANGRVDGFVIENKAAGGHNAPPRGPLKLSDQGEPVYGAKDEVDFAAVRGLGVPFWIAGSCASPEKLLQARELGAAGIQVGTAFALSNESGLDPQIKAEILRGIRSEVPIRVFTDPLASPSGFPFKVVDVEGSLSNPELNAARTRKCDLGYLRRPFKKADGTVGYRCPAEPIESYVKKGGQREETTGRKCLCNGLLATVSLPQLQENGDLERPLVTTGDDLASLKRFLYGDRLTYSAGDVVRHLLSALTGRHESFESA